MKPDLVLRIDWEQFLGRHDMIWDRLPESWEEGAFTGNGLLGAMVYGNGEKELVWDMGRSDITTRISYKGSNPWSDSPVNFRLPLGRMALRCTGTIRKFSMRLNLWNAEINGNVETEKGQIAFRSFTHTHNMIQLIEANCTGDEKDCRFYWQPYPSVNPRKAVLGEEETEHHPPPAMKRFEGHSVCVQEQLDGGGYATAWKECRIGEDRKILYLSTARSDSMAMAELESAIAVNQAATLDLAECTDLHRTWWHSYYRKSFLSIPDARIEGFYWIQMYKLGSASRPERPAMDLMGPWFKMTRWPAIWWNLNIQLAYWPVYASNHLEIGESLIRMLDGNASILAANAEPYSTDSASISVVTGYDCAGKTQDPSDLVWALHNYWLHYRYSMNDNLLRDGLYPLLRRAVNLYIHHLKEDGGGVLHLPLMTSPEYPKMAEDANYALSLLKWGCQTLLWIVDRLKGKDPLKNTWEDILNRLTPYPAGEEGLWIGKDVPFEISHRHFSHLLMIYPLYTMNWEQEEYRDFMVRSVNHWQSLEGAMCGYSFIGAAGMYASMRMPNKALDMLNRFLNNEGHSSMGAKLLRNTMYWETLGKNEANPTLETPLAFGKALQDLLMQSWGDKIRIFPAVPDDWQHLCFHNLLAEGAFLVSAVRAGGNTRWIKIESLAGEYCRVVTDWIGAVQVVSDRSHTVYETRGGELEIGLGKGETVLLWQGDEIISPIIEPANQRGVRNE